MLILGKWPDNLHFFVKLITLIKYRIDCLKMEENGSLPVICFSTFQPCKASSLCTEIKSFGHPYLLHTLSTRNRTEQVQISEVFHPLEPSACLSKA